MTAVNLIVEDLSRADHLPASTLRKAASHPEAIAGVTLPLLEAAAAGRDLDQAEANTLFWGLHLMAQARDSRAFLPLLALLRQDIEVLDELLGDALTATLSRVLASLFDGDADPLFRLILDSSQDGYVRQAAMLACTFLCIDGRVERTAMHDLLIRFDDAKAAVEGDFGWSGWEEAVAILGMRDLAARVEAAQKDGRIDPDYSEPAWFRDALREAERRPDDRGRLDRLQYGYLDDPVEALNWTAEGYGAPQRNPFKDVGRNDPCPCGSGKKFKKCCLDRETVDMPWVPPLD